MRGDRVAALRRRRTAGEGEHSSNGAGSGKDAACDHEQLGAAASAAHHPNLPRLPLERRILVEDRALELLQIAARLEAELAVENGTGLAVDLERIGLTALTVESKHELSPGPLPVRIFLDEAVELGQDAILLAERDPCVDAIRARLAALAFQPPDRLLGEARRSGSRRVRGRARVRVRSKAGGRPTRRPRTRGRSGRRSLAAGTGRSRARRARPGARSLRVSSRAVRHRGSCAASTRIAGRSLPRFPAPALPTTRESSGRPRRARSRAAAGSLAANSPCRGRL